MKRPQETISGKINLFYLVILTGASKNLTFKALGLQIIIIFIVH